MAVDLHTHSHFSDGSDSPEQLVAAAVAARLSTFALTDHDTLEGIATTRAAAARAGMGFVPGVELSLEWDCGGMHLIVLFLEPSAGPLQDRLERLRTSRAGRNEQMVDRLNALGYDIDLSEVLAEAGQGVAGRPHLAAILVRKGYVSDIPTAFEELLGNGRPAYLGRERLEPEEAIRLAVASGAVPVLAHPHTLGLDTSAEYAAVFERLASAGLAAIECHYPEYDGLRRGELEAMARRFGMIAGGGSDYHGTYKEGLSIGTGYGDLNVPDRVLDELRDRRP